VPTVPSRLAVLAELGDRPDYEAAGRRWGIPPGLAFMIATGLPADGSDGLAPEDYRRPGMLEGSTQHLVNPPAANPTTKPHILEWIRRRARADQAMQGAAGRDLSPSMGRPPARSGK